MTARFLLLSVLMVAASLWAGTSAAEPSGNPLSPHCWLEDGPIYETHPCYHGGKFRGITDYLPQIAELGVKTIYLMPVWEQPYDYGNQPERRYRNVYKMKDFRLIDPFYGTPADLRALVDAAHARGMKVLFDLVPSHTWKGCALYDRKPFHKMPLAQLEKLLKARGASLEHKTVRGEPHVYYNLIERDNGAGRMVSAAEIAGVIVGDDVLLYQFPNMWGIAVDYTNEEAIRYFAEGAAWCVKEFGIDGWRVDAPVSNWNHRLIREDHSARKLLARVKEAITQAKPGAVLISESVDLLRWKPGGRRDLLSDEMCDASYNYDFERAFFSVLQKKQPAHTLVDTVANEPVRNGRLRLHFTETHDSPRDASVNSQLGRSAAVLVATLPGVPMIQAGQEVGATQTYGFPVDWAAGNAELRKFFCKVFRLRRENDVLRSGSLKNVWKSGGDVCAYARIYRGECIVAVVNLADHQAACTVDLPLDSHGILTDKLGGGTFAVTDPHNVPLTVPAFEARVLVFNGKR